MKGFAKFWFGAFILSMIFYYMPVYLFSNNMQEAIMSLKFKRAAHVALINAMAPGMEEGDDKDRIIDAGLDQAAKSGHFDADITLGDALKNNPNVQSSDLVFGTSIEGMISPVDPLYHDMDVGLKITFRDGSGLVVVFDAINKSFFGGHGAKVFHVVDGFHFNSDGRISRVQNDESLAGLVMMIFAHDQNAFPSMYNKFFGAKVPIGQNVVTSSGDLGQLLANAQSDSSSTPAAAPNNSQPQTTAQPQAATPPPAPASVPQAPASAMVNQRANFQGASLVHAPTQQSMQQALQRDAGRTGPATAGTQ